MAYGTVNADIIQSSVSGVSLGAGNASIMKNRIINGAMVIDQRNAGASVSTTNSYPVDRFFIGQATTGAWTSSRTSGAPTGFTNSLQFTKTTGNAPASGDYNYLSQSIEGYNIADLGWGTASAKTVTLSFWVYSGATGAFGGSLRNGAGDRSYPFTYTISSSNTWTYCSVTVTGDTTGTWLTTNGKGIAVFFDLGSGTSARATSGAWAAGNYVGATGTSTYPVSTSGGSVSFTGVQLEVGTSATGFEYVNYQTSLANCQRYYYKTTPVTVDIQAVGGVISATTARVYTAFPVTMRTPPTALEQSGTAGDYGILQGASGITCSAVPTFLTASVNSSQTALTVASGATVSSYAMLRNVNTNAYLAWSAEL